MARRKGRWTQPHRLLCLALIVTAVSAADQRSLRADVAKDDAGPFPAGDPAQLGVDVAALERLKARAETEMSDAVLVVKDGRLIADWTFGKPRGPIEAMSCTKSVVSLAIGRLLDMGKIKSLDQPVSDFFLEWRQGRKRNITVRHLLNHTSGLEDKPTTEEINASPDYVQFALAADVASDPGAIFFYSNKATNLLAGVVSRVSGQTLEEFVKHEICTPLGITDFAWSNDDYGNPIAMAGLKITAVDFAKIGQLMLDEGVWHGHRVLSREWVSESIRQGQPHNCECGLLWWRTPEKLKLAVDDDLVNDLKSRFSLAETSTRKLEGMKGNVYEAGELWPRIFRLLRDDANNKLSTKEINDRFIAKPLTLNYVGQGPLVSFSARGYLGQCLVVVPKHRIVAVRQRRSHGKSDPNDDRGNFGDFEAMVRAIVR